MRRLTGIFLILLVLGMGFTHVSFADNTFVMTTFDIGGVSHLFRYRSDMEQFAQAALEAVEKSVTLYEILFDSSTGASSNMGFQVFVDVKTIENGNILASARIYPAANVLPVGQQPVTDKVCRITVYNRPDALEAAPATDCCPASSERRRQPRRRW